MALMLRLEDFDEPAAGAREAAPLPQDLPGYEAGFEDGLQAARAEQNGIDAELVQTLNDMAFGFAEARQHLIHSLVPLFQALVDQLLPQVIDTTFRLHLIDALTALTRQRVSAPIRLIVHPDQVDAVAALLPSVSGLEVDLHHDAEVGPHGALISQGPVESLLEIDDLIQEIHRILSALTDPSEPQQKDATHG